MPRKWSENIGFFGFLSAVFTLIVWVGNDYWIEVFEDDEPSVSAGKVSNGGLVNGKRLPSSGPNFQTYSRLGSLIGRTCVHHAVRDTIVESYAEVFQVNPEWRFVYGETGWCTGGPFKPHKTHQNGLSVDFMIPIRDNGASTPLPTWPWNKWGYNLVFSDSGKLNDWVIDFDALVAHLHALDKAAKEHGLKIEKIILEPPLHDEVFKAKDGKKLKRLPWMEKAAWVRHDNHYHVDFKVVD